MERARFSAAPSRRWLCFLASPPWHRPTRDGESKRPCVSGGDIIEIRIQTKHHGIGTLLHSAIQRGINAVYCSFRSSAMTPTKLPSSKPSLGPRPRNVLSLSGDAQTVSIPRLKRHPSAHGAGMGFAEGPPRNACPERFARGPTRAFSDHLLI